MAKKKATTETPDPTNSTEPTPNSAPLDEAQANPNAATGDESDQTNVNEAPAPDDVNDPEVQASQPEEAPADTTASPTTEASLTHEGDTTQTVPAGTADATADHTADGQHNGTENTHPQSPVHGYDDLDEDTIESIIEAHNQPGAVVAQIAADHDITPELVLVVIDEHAARNGSED